jgi:hypothetical protein
LIESYGGGKGFVRDRYAQLISTAGDIGAFLASAVQETNDGNQAADPKFKPVGVVEPLGYVLRRLNQKDQKRAAEAERQRQAEMARRAEKEREREETRATLLWTVICAVTFGFIAAAAFVTWWLINQ